MIFDGILRSLQATPFATEIRENDALFPWIESVHVLAITLVVGSIAIVDLRLLGWASMDRPAARLTSSILPITWTAFGVAAITGASLFVAKALAYSNNFYFQGKMILLILAGINMALFHALAGQHIETWSADTKPPIIAKIAGGLSLTLWILIVGFGRWIGFTLH
jgi:hypothetical protein